MSARQTVMVHNARTKTDTCVAISAIEKPQPNKIMLLKWQNMLEFVANLLGVTMSKITRIDQVSIDVILTNSQATTPNSRHQLGGRSLDETLISQGQRLVVEDTSISDHWQGCVALPTAYLGLTIQWPDKEVFGTLAIEDTKVHKFSDSSHKLIASFRDIINTDLALLMKSDDYNMPSIAPIKTGICLFNASNLICSWNKSAELILTYEVEEVIGKPISFIFPMIDKINEPGLHMVVTANHELKGLYIEKSMMLDGAGDDLKVLSFSDQTEHLSQNTGGVGELHRDEQSGLYNHHSIVELLNQEVKRAHRYRHPLTLVAVRIDGYEFIEGIHGEGSLDLIIQTLAIILKNETRDVDGIGRIANDLFVVSLPNTDYKSGTIVAKRISKVSARYSDDETPFTVTTACMEVTEPVVDWEMALMILLNNR